MENIEESVATIKKLFDNMSQDYKRNEDIFEDLKIWYGYHGCADGKEHCDDFERIEMISVKEGMLGMLDSVVSDLFVKGDCSVKGNIGTADVEPWIAAVDKKLNKVETEMNAYGISRKMDDMFVLQKDVGDLWENVKELTDAAAHFKNDTQLYHDQNFDLAEDVYGLQYEWYKTNRNTVHTRFNKEI